MFSELNRAPRWLSDFGPLILWLGLIFWFSAQSNLLDLDNQIEEGIIYKSAHMVVYAILLWLWWRTLAPQRQFTWPVLGLAVALTVLYAISDEIHQLFVPGRHGRVSDVLFDTGGALAMVLLIRRVSWLRKY